MSIEYCHECGRTIDTDKNAEHFTPYCESRDDSKFYYTPPEDKLFDELKEKAIELWREVDSDNDKYGYASEKINKIKDIKNISDNFMYMVAMFDHENQKLLAEKVSDETRNAVRARMIAGGNPVYLLTF